MNIYFRCNTNLYFKFHELYMSYKKSFIMLILFFVCSQDSVSQNLNASVVNVVHADTVEYNDPVMLLCAIVNTGSFAIYDSICNVNIICTSPSVPINQAPLYFTFQHPIPSQIFFPGDTLFIDLFTNPIPGGPFFYSTAGDNLIVIWPSFETPVTADTSITPVFVTSTITDLNEFSPKSDLQQDIYIYDVLGKRHKTTNNIPFGNFYIRNGKKFIRR